MAGQLKEVRNRIKSVQSTQQITKAMKMVSAAKLRRAQDAITQMRPYAQKLQEMLSNIVSSIEGGMNLKLAEERPVEKVLADRDHQRQGIVRWLQCQHHQTG
jgi:F-type H+-transporting ATPase subunit gamma